MNTIAAGGAFRLLRDDTHADTVNPPPSGDLAAVRTRGGSERRVHRRLSPQELDWLREARLKYGPAVRVIDVSAGGALVETQVQLRPNSVVVLHLICADVDMVVPSRVLRCHVSALQSGPWYRSACAFTRSLTVPALLSPSAQLLDPPPGDYVQTEFALKNIVDRYVELENCDAHASPSNHRTMLLDALQLLKASAEQRTHASDRKLAAMVASVLSGFQGGSSATALMAHLEDQLRQALPLLTMRVSGLPVAPSDGAESIYFDVTADNRIPAGVLNVQFPAGFAPDAAQFRLLKTTAYLVTLLRACQRRSGESGAQAEPVAAVRVSPVPLAPDAADVPVAPEPLPHGWHRIVVRFVDGRLLRGYTNDFQPWNAQLRLRPSPTSTADPLLVPLTQLKAVFFVKDLSGDSSHVDQAVFDRAVHGRKMEVTFSDGEVLLGSTLNYQPNAQGFFLFPADSTGNNLRVYVISAAVRYAKFLSRA